MRTNWPRVRLGDVLVRRVPDVTVDTTSTYRFAGVYSFGRGVFRRQERRGVEFAYNRLTRLRQGEFVYPKLMAWEGAFGIVPPACEGCYVSPEFPVFEIDSGRLAPAFLGLYFQMPAVWEFVSGRSTGTNVRRRRLHPSELLRHEMPLPPLAEQQWVVARIEEVAALVQEARFLRKQIMQETERVMASAEKKIWSGQKLIDAPRLDCLTLFLARGRQSEQGESNHFLIKTQHVQLGHYVRTAMRLAPDVAAKVNPEAIAMEGDILIACSAAGCLGRVARYRDDGRVVSTDTHVAIARANPNAVDPDYLYAYLRGGQGQYQLRSRERGDGQREKVGFRLTELNLRDLEAVPVPLPDREEQRRIVREVDALQAEVDALKRLQAESAAELDALLQAVFARAFMGELRPSQFSREDS